MTPRLAAAVAFTAAVLLVGGCDADGDGLDDQTGLPVATAHQGGATSGCNQHGLAALQPEHCRGGDASEPTADAGEDPAVLRVRARHEAGHKAVADEYGWTVLSAWICRDCADAAPGDQVGKVTVAGLNWKDPQQRLVFFAAGEVAAGTSSGAGGDQAAADEIVAEYDDVDETAAWDEAERIVQARAAQIDRDAAELLADGRL